MVKITGADTHARRLERMKGPRAVEAVTRALYGGAQDVQITAQLSITRGATSGKNHVPSKPGEPPNNDTGVLANNIEAAVVGPLKTEASSNAPYALPQEFGSEKIGLPERPYMRPAAKQARPRVVKRVLRAINRVLR